MIRSSKISLLNANKNKLETLRTVQIEYNKVISSFIEMLWLEERTPKLLGKEYTSKISSWLSARMIQSAGKQASGIVRGTKKKQEKRIYIYKKLLKEQSYKKARKLKTIIDKENVSIPFLKDLAPMELDSRFIKIQLNNPNSFDGWITISSIGKKLKLEIPFKKHKQFNKLLTKGKVKQGLRLSYDSASIMFEVEKPVIKTSGKTIGIDIGIKDVYTSSDGQQPKVLNGHTLNSIQKRLSLKKKGSKSFGKAQKLRDNYINWSVNQLNLSDIKQVNREDIKDLRRGKGSSRLLASWTYPLIFSKLERYCEEQGVLVSKVSPVYTSQRCSTCGWTQKRNRLGKEFKCVQCGNTLDSDLNASKNISLSLLPFRKSDCLTHPNRKGFYWRELSQELIVPDVQRSKTL